MTFQLSIAGDAGVQVRGTCVVHRARSDQVIEIAGPAPIARTLTGEDVACRLEADGQIVVELEAAGRRSRAATSGGMVSIASGRSSSTAAE